MDPAGRIPVFGTYEQERLYILISVDELKHELIKVRTAAAVEREAVVVKAQKDLNALHSKVRVLEARKMELTLRNWITTAALSAAVAVIFELGKLAFSRL